MHLPRSIFVISLLACGCQGLEPIDLTKGQGQGGTDTGGANVVQLGDLRIEPATISFGVVGLEDVVGETVVLTNTGSDDLIVRQTSIDGDAEFTVSSTTSLPTQLGEDDEIIIEVSFAPTGAENYSAGLLLDVNNLDEPYLVEVTGSGEGAAIDTGDTDTDDPPAGELDVSPTSVDFGEVPTNQAGSVGVTLTNNHSDNILIQQIVGNPSEFSYQPGGDITLPQVISPGESRSLDLTFDPADEVPYSGDVTLTLDVSGTASSLVIPVQGVGVEPPCEICAPIVSVSPNPLSITAPISCNKTETVSITNIGDQDLEISDITVTNDSLIACGTFSLGSGATSASLTPGASTTIDVTFDATVPLCTERPNLSRDFNILHIANNSGQPDYTVEMSAFATCPGGA
jgi:hypothetical protein